MVAVKNKKNVMVTVNYSSNNSGGSWWLNDSDWKALEKAGWTVEWRNKPMLKALATNASIKVKKPGDAIKSFKKATNQDPWAEGCNCCGRPHNFSYTDAKGETHYPEVEVKTTFGGWR